MVNRAIQAKDHKRKMRGKSKRHSKKVVNTGTNYMNYSSGPNKEEMGLMKARTGNTIFRDRNGSIHVNRSLAPDVIAFWESVYPSMKYSRKELKERGLPDEYGMICNNPVPRGEALRRADELKLLEGQNMSLRYRHKAGPTYNLDIFFNAQRNKFYILETDLDRRRIRKSNVYPNKEMLLTLFPKHISWESVIYIPPDDSS
jgi:hypothetical protein